MNIAPEVTPAEVPDDYMSNYDGFEKEWISTSSLATYIKCGLRFQFCYIDKMKGSQGMRQTMGSAAHKSREVNLTQKVKSQEDMNIEEVTDVARDYVCETFESNEIEIGKEWDGKSKDSARGIAVDMSVEMAEKDRLVFQPEIQPAAVEETLAISFPDISRIIVGKLDVREDYDGNVIRDLKTGKRAFGQAKADDGMGLTTYGMLALSSSGIVIDKYLIDNVVNSGKTPCKTVAYETTRTKEELQKQLQRFALVCRNIDKGVFMCADPQEWYCSKEWCGYHDVCPYAG